MPRSSRNGARVTALVRCVRPVGSVAVATSGDRAGEGRATEDHEHRACDDELARLGAGDRQRPGAGAALADARAEDSDTGILFFNDTDTVVSGNRAVGNGGYGIAAFLNHDITYTHLHIYIYTHIYSHIYTHAHGHAHLHPTTHSPTGSNLDAYSHAHAHSHSHLHSHSPSHSPPRPRCRRRRCSPP